jgi:hypothetical protein
VSISVSRRRGRIIKFRFLLSSFLVSEILRAILVFSLGRKYDPPIALRLFLQSHLSHRTLSPISLQNDEDPKKSKSIGFPRTRSCNFGTFKKLLVRPSEPRLLTPSSEFAVFSVRWERCLDSDIRSGQSHAKARSLPRRLRIGGRSHRVLVTVRGVSLQFLQTRRRDPYLLLRVKFSLYE